MKGIFGTALTTLLVTVPLYAQSSGSGSMGSDASGTSTMGTGTTAGPAEELDSTRTPDQNLGTGSSTIDDRQMQEDVSDEDFSEGAIIEGDELEEE